MFVAGKKSDFIDTTTTGKNNCEQVLYISKNLHFSQK